MIRGRCQATLRSVGDLGLLLCLPAVKVKLKARAQFSASSASSARNFAKGISLLQKAVAGITAMYDETHEGVLYFANALGVLLAEYRMPARIIGLTSRPELNGSFAEVLAYLPARGRYTVRVRPVGGGASGQRINLKPENLEMAAGAQPEVQPEPESGPTLLELCRSLLGPA